MYSWAIDIDTRRTMNRICARLRSGDPVGLEYNGDSRVVVSSRVCYGGSIELTLDEPLSGTTSGLLKVREGNAQRVLAGMVQSEEV
mgnify:CR=1 FL=1